MAAHCHLYVKKVAQEAAGELFEVLMGQNDLFEMWRKRFLPGTPLVVLERRFVAKYWGACLPFARATMTQMLTKPIDTALKDEIMEALALDASLVRGRQRPDQLMRQLMQQRQDP